MRSKGQAPRETAEWAYEGLLNACRHCGLQDHLPSSSGEEWNEMILGVC